jgi:hypothetical protein
LISSTVVYSISPHYKGNDESHVFWFEKALGSAVRAQGFRFESITGFEDSTEHVIKALGHTSTQRHKLLFTPWSGLIRDVLRIRRLVRRDSADIVWHVYDGGFREFILLVVLLSVFKKSNGVFNFTTLEPWLAVTGSPKSTFSNTGSAIARIKKVFGSRLVLLADSKELGNALSSDWNFISGEYPLFTFMATADSSQRPLNHSNSVLFSPCNDAELELCLGAIDILTNLGKISIRPIIQLRWGAKISELRVAEIESLGVRLYQESLSAKEYARLYSDCRVAVMPYLNRAYYRFQSSGRLLDSVSKNCVVVVPDETVLGRKASENNWGFTFSSDSSASLASAITKALHEGLEEKVMPPTALDAAQILFGDKEFQVVNEGGMPPILSLLRIATAPLVDLGPSFVNRAYRYSLSAFRKLFRF